MFIQANVIKNNVCKMATISSGPECVKIPIGADTSLYIISLAWLDKKSTKTTSVGTDCIGKVPEAWLSRGSVEDF